jgi:hypothetical protein
LRVRRTAIVLSVLSISDSSGTTLGMPMFRRDEAAVMASSPEIRQAFSFRTDTRSFRLDLRQVGWAAG